MTTLLSWDVQVCPDLTTLNHGNDQIAQCMFQEICVQCLVAWCQYAIGGQAV